MVTVRYKILPLLCLLLCGCARPAEAQDVRAHFAELSGFTAHVKIISDLGKSVLEYEEEYSYNKEGSDGFTIVKPDALAGIQGTIAGKNSAECVVQYAGTVLDAAMPERTGLTPADAVFCLIADLKNETPAQEWTERAEGEELTVLSYSELRDGCQTEKQIWLSAETMAPLYAELYADGARVLTLQFSAFHETAAE